MANGIQNVGFQSPGYDYTGDLMDIERRKALANAMQSQSMQPIEEQRGGRFAVPISPFQGLAKMAQGYTAGVAQRSAQEKAQELSARSQSDYANMVQRGLGQLQGTPMSEDASGNVTPAQGPDPAGAMATFGSHPMGAALMPVAMQEMQRQRTVAMVKAMQEAAARQSAAPQQSSPQLPVQYSGGQFQSQPTPPQPQGAPQAPQQSIGGPAFGIPMEALLESDPTGKLYFEQLAKSRAPINVRPGGTVYTPGMGAEYTAPQNGIQTQQTPQGPVAGPVPGYVPTQAAITSSNAAAQAGGHEYGQAPYQTQTLQTAPNPTVMTNQQIIQRATGQPMPLPYGMSGAGGAPQQPQGAQPPGQPQGVPGRMPGLQLQDQGASAEQRETGKGLGEYVNSHMQNASKAAVANRYLDNMEIAAQGIKTGKLADAQSTLIQWGQALGLPLPQEAKNAAGDIGALNSMAIKMAGTATRQSDAQPSQIQFLKTLEAMPSTARTPEMFTRIVGYMRDLNNYDIAKMQSLDAWRHDPRHGGSAAGFEAAWPQMAARMPFVWNQTKTQNLKGIAAGGANPQGGGNVVEWSDLGRSTPKR